MAPVVSTDDGVAIEPSSASGFDDLSPFQVSDQLRARNIGTSAAYDPGHGVLNPHDIHNVGFFVLFALIGVGFIAASLWFFFWARNGGFHFKKGDWDDYKSTVLRRKGPDGKTLTNATKSTKLGGGSVVGSEYTDTSYTSYQESIASSDLKRHQKKKRHHKKANKYDADVRDYRNEKPARVGGLNKEPDGNGTVHDWSTAASNLSSRPAISEAPRHQHTKPSRRDFSFNQGSDLSFSAVSSDVSSNAPLRPQHPPRYTERAEREVRRESRTSPQQYRTNRERRSQGFYADRAREGTYAEPINFRHGERRGHHSSATRTAQVENTKVYKHVVSGGAKDGKRTGSGFRRSGGGRRDSIGEPEGTSYTYR